jgi:hypothetical protein
MHKKTSIVAVETAPSLTPFMSRRRFDSRGSRWEGAAVVLLSQLIAVVSAPPLLPKTIPVSPHVDLDGKGCRQTRNQKRRHV